MIQSDDSSKYKVCLLGAAIDDNNMGVRALSISLIGLTLAQRPNAEFTFIYGGQRPRKFRVKVGDREIEVAILNHRLSPSSAPSQHLVFLFLMALVHRAIPLEFFRRWIRNRIPILATLSEADFIGEIRGGDSFSDIYGLGRLIAGLSICHIAALLGKEYHLLPQTYGPFGSSMSRGLARLTLRRAAALYARDRDSIQIVRELLGEKGRDIPVHYCPDVAFTLEARGAESVRFEPELCNEGNAPIIGLNVSGLLAMGGYSRDNMFDLQCDYNALIDLLLERLLRETDAEILILPHVMTGEIAEGDYPACRDAWSRTPGEFRHRVHLLEGFYDQSEIKHIIGHCDFMIASRMHACIAALSQGVPSVGLAYSRKFEGVFGSIDASDLVIDIRRMNPDAIVTECIDHFRARKEALPGLEEKMLSIQRQIRRHFEDLMRPRDSSVPWEGRPRKAPFPFSTRPEALESENSAATLKSCWPTYRMRWSWRNGTGRRKAGASERLWAEYGSPTMIEAR